MQYEIEVDGFAEQEEEAIQFELSEAEMEIEAQKREALASYDKEVALVKNVMGEAGIRYAEDFPAPTAIETVIDKVKDIFAEAEEAVLVKPQPTEVNVEGWSI